MVDGSFKDVGRPHIGFLCVSQAADAPDALSRMNERGSLSTRANNASRPVHLEHILRRQLPQHLWGENVVAVRV